MYFRLSLLLLYSPTRCYRISPQQNHNIGQSGSGRPKNLRSQTWFSSNSSLDHNDVSLPTPLSAVGLVYRVPMGLRTWFLGTRLSFHLPIFRGLHHCATHPVGHVCKSISPLSTPIGKANLIFPALSPPPRLVALRLATRVRRDYPSVRFGFM